MLLLSVTRTDGLIVLSHSLFCSLCLSFALGYLTGETLFEASDAVSTSRNTNITPLVQELSNDSSQFQSSDRRSVPSADNVLFDLICVDAEEGDDGNSCCPESFLIRSMLKD